LAGIHVQCSSSVFSAIVRAAALQHKLRFANSAAVLGESSHRELQCQPLANAQTAN
jgi:hypothetical protein